MRSPRNVSTSNWMPGNCFRISRISSIHLLLLLAGQSASARRGTRCGAAPTGLRPVRRGPPAVRRWRCVRSGSSSSEICVADPQHFRQRSAGRGEDLEHEMAFAEFRQELAAEERQPRQRQRRRSQRPPPMMTPRPAGDEAQHAPITRLQPALGGAVPSALRTPLSKNRNASAGVTVSATSSEARIARI